MKLGTQLWALITVVVVIALVAGGYFLGVAPLLEQRALAESAEHYRTLGTRLGLLPRRSTAK